MELYTVRWRGGSSAHAPVVLVHGLGDSTLAWETVGPVLAERTKRDVVAVDLPGFGQSPPVRRSAPVRRAVDAILDLLDGVGPAVLVGNSMGGVVTVTVAARRPDLVERLVLVAPALPAAPVSIGALLGALRFVPAALPGVGTMVVGTRARVLGPERATAARLATLMCDPTRVDPEVRLRMVALAEARMRRRECHRAYATAARSVLAAAPAAWRLVPSLECPTLVVHGTQDALVPVALVDRLKGVRPDWTYEVLDDCGHLPQLEHPERFADTLARWLDAPSSSCA